MSGNTAMREARLRAGLSQSALAFQVGVSRQTINAIETGKFDPSIWLAYDLARLFGFAIEELFDFEGSVRK